MFLRKTAFACFVLYLFNISVFAQQEGLLRIDTTDLKRHLEFIASDDLQGRSLETEIDGLGMAAAYLAEHARKIGLKPGVPGYFQDVPIVFSESGSGRRIEVCNKKGKSSFVSDKIVKIYKSPDVVSLRNEEVVFIGFGEQVEEIELKEKVVVVSEGGSAWFTDSESVRIDISLERKKIEAILSKEPKAVIIVANPKDRDNKTFNQISAWLNRGGYRLSNNEVEEEPVVLLSVVEVADAILGKKGSFRKYLAMIADGAVNKDVSCDNKINITIGAEIKRFDGKNVVGFVEGCDSFLKDESIVFMAHYDHLGVAGNGDVYNGADDNGSGTVTLMELAEAFAGLKEKPKRSIVFLWVTFEELGQLGAAFYCENPVFPLEKTILCVNLDMVGRVYESPRDDVQKKSPKKVKDFDGLYTLSNDVWPELEKINAAKCKELGLIPDNSLPDYFLRASDHYQFHKNGVPVLNYSTGYHADYHKVGDEVSKINFKKMKRVADLCYLLGNEVANFERIEIFRED